MEPIAGHVARALRAFGPAGDIAAVVAAWPAAVGDSIARHAWPARLARDRTLHVATDSSAWAFELAQLSPVLLERLRAALGEVAPSGLRFAVGPLPEPAAAASEHGPRPVRQPGPVERDRAAGLTASIADEELRALVARAAAASLAQAAADR
jgi:predicted nucleic acid-binding Zn ribbon protein